MIDSLLADPGLEGHQVPMNTPMDTNARRTQLPPLMARGEHPVMPLAGPSPGVSTRLW